MDEDAKKVFEDIKKKAEIDKEIWNEAQRDENPLNISSEQENEILERMFLVYYTEKYLETLEELELLKLELNK